MIGDDVDQEELLLATEPTENERTVARTLWRLYVALRETGFDDQQAMAIVSSTVVGVNGGTTS